MYCGASFASETDRYQTDGRTISNVDDTAYLRSAPPKVKRSRKWIIGVVAVVIVALIAIPLLSNATQSDVTYDYLTGDRSYTQDGVVLTYYVTYYNHMDRAISTDKIALTLKVEGQTFAPYSKEYKWVEAKDFNDVRYSFLIPKEYGEKSISLDAESSDFSIKKK